MDFQSADFGVLLSCFLSCFLCQLPSQLSWIWGSHSVVGAGLRSERFWCEEWSSSKVPGRSSKDGNLMKLTKFYYAFHTGFWQAPEEGFTKWVHSRFQCVKAGFERSAYDTEVFRCVCTSCFATFWLLCDVVWWCVVSFKPSMTRMVLCGRDWRGQIWSADSLSWCSQLVSTMLARAGQREAMLVVCISAC